MNVQYHRTRSIFKMNFALMPIPCSYKFSHQSDDCESQILWTQWRYSNLWSRQSYAVIKFFRRLGNISSLWSWEFQQSSKLSVWQECKSEISSSPHLISVSLVFFTQSGEMLKGPIWSDSGYSLGGCVWVCRDFTNRSNLFSSYNGECDGSDVSAERTQYIRLAGRMSFIATNSSNNTNYASHHHL